MIVDPRARRAALAVAPPAARDASLPGPAEAMGYALELAPLRVLAGWAAVGAKLEAFADALRGDGSISYDDVAQLRTWAHRWRILRPEIRAFYAAHVDDDAIAVILYRILNGGDPLVGPQIGHLRRAWLDHAGEPGDGLELAPIPPPRTPRWPP